jgi:DNA-nicking Smr family endonuclease
MSRRRQLSDEDRALWSGFARSITPLRRSVVAVEPSAEKEAAPLPPRIATRHELPPPIKMPPLSPLERRLKQRVARGREPIEARLDLHGMTQVEAHAALARFLRRAQAEGVRIALIVTGKGTGRGERDAAVERGVLRRQVPLWLSLPEFRPLIVGFEDAHASHGGQGALYVRLRRAR